MALKKHPFDSQVRGALAMDSGRISQMGTGEGKTLTALLPLYLSSLAGKGSHLITVNDFLAQSGFEQNKPALDLVSRDFLKHPAIDIPADVKLKTEVIEDLGPDLPKWTKAWDEVKAG